MSVTHIQTTMSTNLGGDENFKLNSFISLEYQKV